MSLAQSEPEGYFTREAYRAWREAQPRGRFERVEGRILEPGKMAMACPGITVAVEAFYDNARAA